MANVIAMDDPITNPNDTERFVPKMFSASSSRLEFSQVGGPIHYACCFSKSHLKFGLEVLANKREPENETGICLCGCGPFPELAKVGIIKQAFRRRAREFPVRFSAHLIASEITSIQLHFLTQRRENGCRL